MRTTIRNSWAASLLLGAVMAGLIVTPTIAALVTSPAAGSAWRQLARPG